MVDVVGDWEYLEVFVYTNKLEGFNSHRILYLFKILTTFFKMLPVSRVSSINTSRTLCVVTKILTHLFSIKIFNVFLSSLANL